jgi:hypothetical protein
MPEMALKVQKNKNFLLCINNKILGEQFLDWTIMGGATIIPRSLKTKQNKKMFKIGRKFFNF